MFFLSTRCGIRMLRWVDKKNMVPFGVARVWAVVGVFCPWAGLWAWGAGISIPIACLAAWGLNLGIKGWEPV